MSADLDKARAHVSGARLVRVGPAPACGHDHRCEDFDTEPGVHYHAHDLPRCREIAVGSLPVVGWTKFLCQRHIDARLAADKAALKREAARLADLANEAWQATFTNKRRHQDEEMA